LLGNFSVTYPYTLAGPNMAGVLANHPAHFEKG
jgi:hypothetical protein